MGAMLLKLRTWWETADRTQRAVTLFGGVFLVVLLGGTFYFASRPKMTMAFGGLSPADVGTVTAEIQKLGIPVEFDNQGNVLVPSSQVAEVRAKLAVSGKLPASAHVGNEELSKLGMMNTPAVERERIKSILEGELSRSIEQIEGVAAARVHITLGERTAFASEKKPATASVVVQEKSGGVDQASARAIAMMVANGVPGLEPAKVFVVDNAGRALYDGTEQASLGGMATQKLEAERAEALRRERDIQAKLDAVIGRGNSVVTVNVEMDFDRETKEVSELKPNKNPVYVEEATEQVGGQGANSTNGQPGLGANTGTTATTSESTTSNNGYTGTKKMAEYPYTKTDAKTEKAIGGIRKLAIAVMVNEDKVQDATPVESYLQSYIGENEGFTASVTSMKFDTALAEEAKKTAAATAGQERMQQMMSLLPVAALLVVAFVVLKAIGKAAKAQTVMVQALPDGTLVATGGALGSGSAHHHHEGDHHGGHAPSYEGGLAEAISHANGDGMQSLPRRQNIGQEDVGDIEERMNRPLEQLKRMAADRPDSVGLLIKSWMLEERR